MSNTIEHVEQHSYYEPNSWAQQRAGETRVFEALYSGRLGSAKSRTLCEKADERCRLHPGARVAITRRYQTDLLSSTAQTMWRDVISPEEKADNWRPSNPGGATLFYYPEGGRQSNILFVGLDRPGKFNSAEFDLVLIDQAEEVTEEQWDICGGRLRHRHGPYQQLMGFCNPDGPAHFLYKRFRPDLGSHIQRTKEALKLLDGSVMPAGYSYRECILAGRTDNLENLPREYQFQINNMRGTLHKRLVLGQWVMPIGLVYSMYDPAVHPIGTPPEWVKWGGYPPPSWTRFCGIDLGFDNPFVCLWFAQSPDGVLYVYREHYMTNWTVPAHAKRIIECEEDEIAVLRRCARLGGVESQNASWLHRLNVVARFCDHDKGERELLDEAFEKARMVTTSPAEKDINAGLQSVYQRLQYVIRDPKLGQPMFKSRIFFLRDRLVEEDPYLQSDARLPLSMFEEFPRYRWPKRRQNVEEASDSKYDKPVDQDNHAMDALRYGVHSWDRGREVAVY